jgi:transcription elongation factor Elf1
MIVIVNCPYCDAELFIDTDYEDETITCMRCLNSSEITIHENSKVTLEKI